VDGAALAAPSTCDASNCQITVWDIASKHQTKTFATNYWAAATASFGIITMAGINAAEDGVAVWDLRTGKRLSIMTDPDHQPVMSAQISPNGEFVAANSHPTGSNHTIYVWNTATEQVQAALTVPAGYGFSEFGSAMAFDRNGTTLAISDATHTRVYDIASHRLVATLPAPLATLSLDGTLMASLLDTIPARIQLWSVASHKLITTVSFPDNASPAAEDIPIAFAFNASGTELAAGDLHGKTYVWDITGR
jgi:WD40 repeat protein